MQKILSFHILMHLLPHGADRETGSITGKLSGSTNNEKRGNGRIVNEKSISIYKHLRDYSFKGLNDFIRVLYLKWSATIEDMFHHSPFTLTTHDYKENRNLNYLLLYCANTELPAGKGYAN
jgi:hypothetical protein